MLNPLELHNKIQFFGDFMSKFENKLKSSHAPDFTKIFNEKLNEFNRKLEIDSNKSRNIFAEEIHRMKEITAKKIMSEKRLWHFSTIQSFILLFFRCLCFFNRSNP
jgi:hypothetical protein